MRLFSFNPKNYHIIFGGLTLLLGSTIMFVPLFETFTHGEMLSLSHYALVSFSSYLFFTWTLIEVLHVQLLSLGANVFLLTLIAVVASAFALSFDYLVWYGVSTVWLSRLFSEKKLKRYMHYIEKYGYSVLFVFAALPLPIPVMMLTAWLLRLYFPKALLCACIGIFVKYGTIALVIAYLI
jgi:uncharacterized membrane protein